MHWGNHGFSRSTWVNRKILEDHIPHWWFLTGLSFLITTTGSRFHQKHIRFVVNSPTNMFFFCFFYIVTRSARHQKYLRQNSSSSSQNMLRFKKPQCRQVAEDMFHDLKLHISFQQGRCIVDVLNRCPSHPVTAVFSNVSRPKLSTTKSVKSEL